MAISVDNHVVADAAGRAAGDPVHLEDLLRRAVRRAAECPVLDITVAGGVVMLSGMALRREDKSRAGFACWCDPTVRAVYNNLTISSGPA
ncbi:hypothetical protein [Arthrobacter sp. Ld5]|uniref:hypothetical protein n=1 Tax=Arthrobacter sp. Ld5 TaxID=649152 RepID=UPI003EB6A8FE